MSLSSASSQNIDGSSGDDENNRGEHESQRNPDFKVRLAFVESRNVKNTSRPKLQNKQKTRDIYEMTAKPRGYCVIVANYEFKAMDSLSGYSKDLKNLKKVFTQLHFDVHVFHNQTGEEIEDIFRKYANIKPKTKQPYSSKKGWKFMEIDPNAFVGIVLSHGKNEVICGVNDDPDDLDHPDQTSPDSLVTILNNANCPLLQHKPKMLFIQACRGEIEDCGAQNLSCPISTENVKSEQGEKIANKIPPTTATPIKLEPDDKKPASTTNLRCDNLPLSTDTIVCFSTLDGFASYVHQGGSIFGVALAGVLILHSHNMDLNRIICKVMKEIAEEETESENDVNRKQAVEVRNLSFHNQLFFNPGQPREIKQSKSRKSKVSLRPISGQSATTNPDENEFRGDSRERIRKNLSSLLGNENMSATVKQEVNHDQKVKVNCWLRNIQISTIPRVIVKTPKTKKRMEALKNQPKISTFFEPKNT